jgi:hypothetical protein
MTDAKKSTKSTPPIVDADFDDTIKDLLAVKPPLSGKKAKRARTNPAKAGLARGAPKK